MGSLIRQSKDHSDTYKIDSVQRVCAILTSLNTVDGADLETIAEATGMPRSSALHYLQTLEQETFVEHIPATGRYILGGGVGLPVAREGS